MGQKRARMIQFVLLASPRTGSTALRLTLARHPQIRIHGELFHALESDRTSNFEADPYVTALAKRGVDPPSSYRDGTDAAEYVMSTIFVPWETGKNETAVGFKLFYEHARCTPSAVALWDYLITKETIRIIHLSRRNLLAAYLSLVTAGQTGEWIRLRGSPSVSPPSSLNINPVELREFFDFCRAQQRWADTNFSEHLMLQLEYETDIFAGFSNTVRTIYDFLEVPEGPVEPVTMRQALESIPRRVQNYSELKDEFSTTPYAEFFSD
jgi:hypothetical protein